MDYKTLVHRCFRCGYCKFPTNYQDVNCPSYLCYGFETFAPGGRMWTIRFWLQGQLKISKHFQQIIYSCTACANCVKHCAFPGFRDELLNIFLAVKEELVEQGQLPKKVKEVLNSFYLHGNPYGLSAKKRTDWLSMLDPVQQVLAEKPVVANFKSSEHEYLLYMGDVASYDPVAQKMACSVTSLLSKMGISFGIMGTEEISDGNECLSMGERGLFEFLAKKLIEKWQDLNVKKIITLSPHSFHVFVHDYKKLGFEGEIWHFSQLLAQLPEVSLESLPGSKITYHDPCYLGRHNHDYQSVRQVLAQIGGVQVVEMEQNRENSLCCGGGGGNLFTGILDDGPYSVAETRLDQAMKTGAEVLLTACPGCLVMLQNAKQERHKDFKVIDVASFILKGLKE